MNQCRVLRLSGPAFQIFVNQSITIQTSPHQGRIATLTFTSGTIGCIGKVEPTIVFIIWMKLNIHQSTLTIYKNLRKSIDRSNSLSVAIAIELSAAFGDQQVTVG